MGTIGRSSLRTGYIIAPLSAWFVFAVALSCPAADSLFHDAQALKSKHAGEVEKLAAWCEQEGLAAEAKKTRESLGTQDPFKLYLPVLPQEVGPAQPPEDASPAVAQWHAKLRKLRQEQALALFDLARTAVRKHQASLAYQLAMEAIRENPDHEGVRRVFGYQKYRNQWHTAYEVKKLRAGLVWDDKFGWISKSSLDRYQQGERFAGGRWIPAKTDDRLHRDIGSGWKIETEHYLIRTNHSIESAVDLGKKLDNLNRLWQQIFIRFYASEAYVDGLFSGRSQARAPELPHFDVVYFRDREQYNEALTPVMPDIGISLGVYLAQRRTAYFFAGGDDTDRVTYHEATHQLFQQARQTASDVGLRANFWLVEGIAMFMESLHEESGYYVLGGVNDVRINAARYHLAKQDFYEPFKTVTGLGMKELQSHPKIAKLYSQMAAMTHFLVYYDGGRYRDALVACLSAVYNGNQDPALLSQLTGASYAELDRQYREFIESGQPRQRSSSE